MTQRRFSLIIIALPAFLGMTLSSCTSPESESSSEAPLLPNKTETVDLENSETPADSQAVAGITNVETASDAASDDSSSKPKSNSTHDEVADSSKSPSAGSDSSATEPKPAETQAKDVEKPEIADISIDETVCGAGGQEAYFETRVQEIYICKNAAGSLTYIATPKKKGNSSFLPAQKIQQGDIVGYAAIDEAKTYIVTPGGFQLQENGKPAKSEKVIRRQLGQE